MADIIGKFYSSRVIRRGVSPSNPGNIDGEEPVPVNPPSSGSGIPHEPVTIGTPANGLSITAGQVLSLGLASAGVTGALSGSDWSTFNGKIGGSGTTNYLAKFTSSGTVGDSAVYESGGNVGIGTTSPTAKLQVTGDLIRLENGSQNNILGVDSVRAYISAPNGFLAFDTVLLEAMRISNFQNLLIGTIIDSGHKLNVNGDVRIQSIANATGNFLTVSATGVVQQRTAGELKSDLGLGSNLNDILITTNSTFVSNAGARFYKQAEHGTAIQSSTGSTNDFALLTPIGGLKMVIPTGQNNIIFNRFDGAFIGIGNITPTEKIDTDGTARLRGIASGTGDPVVVDANGKLWKGSGSSASEATFTPSMSAIGGGVTYSFFSQEGFYYKIGKLVFFAISLSIDATSGTPSGSLVITGLPFTYNALDAGTPCAVTISGFLGSSFTTAQLDLLSANIVDGESRVVIRLLNGTVTAPTFSNGSVVISGSYTTNS